MSPRSSSDTLATAFHWQEEEVLQMGWLNHALHTSLLWVKCLSPIPKIQKVRELRDWTPKIYGIPFTVFLNAKRLLLIQSILL